MKTKWFGAAFFALGFLLAIQVPASQAQKAGKALSLLYSNNINGEVDPCPT